jgi:hypothetical protein
MPRCSRSTPEGSLQHIIAKFVEDRWYFDVPGARDNYLARLGSALSEHDCVVLAYSLMSNHLHLVLLMALIELERLFKRVNSGFATWLNRKLERRGPIFAGRFKNISIADDLTGILIPYAHNNEVRAGVIRNPLQSRWSSHRFYAGFERPPAWLHVERGLECSGFDSTYEGRRDFCDWVQARSSDPRIPAFSGEGDDDAARALLRELPRSASLRSPRVDRLGQVSWSADIPKQWHEGDRWRGSALDAVSVASWVAGVSSESLRGRSKAPAAARGRAALLVAWRDGLGRAQAELARYLGMSSSAASNAYYRARKDVEICAAAARIATHCRSTDLSLGGAAAGRK